MLDENHRPKADDDAASFDLLNQRKESGGAQKNRGRILDTDLLGAHVTIRVAQIL